MMTRRIMTLTAALALAAGSLATEPAPEAAPVATSSVTGTMLVISPQIAYTSAKLRVGGPDGYEAVTWGQGGDLALDLVADGMIAASDGRPAGPVQALADGRYGYEVVLHQADGGQRAHSGVFVVDGGVSGASTSEHRAVTAQSDNFVGAGATAAAVDEGPSAESAVNDTLQVLDASTDNETFLALQNNTWTDPGDWAIVNKDGDLRFQEITEAGPVEPFRMTLKDNGNVGVGTTQPGAEFHVAGPGGVIRISDTDACPGDISTWEIEEDFGRLMFDFVGNCDGDTPGGKMWLTADGDVGIGTNNPGEELEIVRAFPSIRFNSPGSYVWDIEGNGVDFQVQDVTNSQTAPFLIKPGAGHHALVLAPGRQVGIGTFSPSARLHVNGDARIEGDFSIASSRTLKTGFARVTPTEMLARVADLPVASWRYKTEEDDRRHVGPFAEDFQRLFGLGDGETISVIDAQGVAFAAIQGLQQELAEKDAEVEALYKADAERDAQLTELRSENAGLAARLTAVEKALDR